MVRCLCCMVKAVVSENFGHTEDVYMLHPCFLFLFFPGIFIFFQESSLSVILVIRIKICRYLTRHCHCVCCPLPSFSHWVL